MDRPGGLPRLISQAEAPIASASLYRERGVFVSATHRGERQWTFRMRLAQPTI
jgi:hypothetical protein